MIISIVNQIDISNRQYNQHFSVFSSLLIVLVLLRFNKRCAALLFLFIFIQHIIFFRVAFVFFATIHKLGKISVSICSICLHMLLISFINNSITVEMWRILEYSRNSGLFASFLSSQLYWFDTANIVIIFIIASMTKCLYFH